MARDSEWYAALENGTYPILACPGCKHVPRRDNLIDSLHPTNQHPDCLFVFGCLVCEGGCDDWQAYGRTAKEAVDRWNAQTRDPNSADVVIGQKLEDQLRTSVRFWANKCEDVSKQLRDQLAITDSLKRDLSILQGRTVQPCPAAEKMGEHACTNQHECWGPCGVMGNDERFVAKPEPPIEESHKSDVTFRGVKIVGSDEPLMLPITQQRRNSKIPDSGLRRRRSD